MAKLRAALSDAHFLTALLAGLAFWLVLFLLTRTSVDVCWFVDEPLRFALLVFVYPVLEEVVFRGGLQTLLLRYPSGRQSCCGVTVANVLTGVCFALMHTFTHAVLWAVGAFIPSLIFGYFRDRHATLVAPTVLHIYYNAGYFLLFGS